MTGANSMTDAPEAKRDHGGGLDNAIHDFGGSRSQWIDLSTGINPEPYPIGDLHASDWTALPDSGAQMALLDAARAFWNIPDTAALIAAPGASALIARIPALAAQGTVTIPTPTYNEHAAAFAIHGWTVSADNTTPDAQVLVHPNNPDGRLWSESSLKGNLRIIDESFCDIAPDQSLIAQASKPGTLVLKSFGKFWGLAGLRLGFAIGDPTLITKLTDLTGPWAVSGPALRIGAQALQDTQWANLTRTRLASDAARLDTIMEHAGAKPLGGTSLFRLYDTDSAENWQNRLAQHHIWSRIFPYSRTWLRLGLPPADGWAQLENALS